VGLLVRVCKLCGESFEYGYIFGRPREYCYRCEPDGWKVVLPKHPYGRVKLRRLHRDVPLRAVPECGGSSPERSGGEWV
jgi:hypothetical protein